MTLKEIKAKRKEHLQDIVEAVDMWLDKFCRGDCPSSVGAVIQRYANEFLWPDEIHYPYARYDMISCRNKAQTELHEMEAEKGWLIG